jgi:hypothetical protein
LAEVILPFAVDNVINFLIGIGLVVLMTTRTGQTKDSSNAEQPA